MNMDIDVDDRDEISKHQVLQSNAGYYVGTLYFDSEMNGWFPNSRVSDYFKTKTEAEIHLDYLQKYGTDSVNIMTNGLIVASSELVEQLSQTK